RQLFAGVHPLRRAWISDDESRLAVDRRARVEPQVIGRRRRLAVLIGAQEACIERVAREVEIVRIAAELRRLRFGHPDKPNVAVLAIGVELVRAARVKLDTRAAAGRFVGATRTFQTGGRRIARLDCGFAGRRADRVLYVRRHVTNSSYHFGLLSGAL